MFPHVSTSRDLHHSGCGGELWTSPVTRRAEKFPVIGKTGRFTANPVGDELANTVRRVESAAPLSDCGRTAGNGSGRARSGGANRARPVIGPEVSVDEHGAAEEARGIGQNEDHPVGKLAGIAETADQHRKAPDRGGPPRRSQLLFEQGRTDRAGSENIEPYPAPGHCFATSRRDPISPGPRRTGNGPAPCALTAAPVEGAVDVDSGGHRALGVARSTCVQRVTPDWLRVISSEPELAAMAPVAHRPWIAVPADFIGQHLPVAPRGVCKSLATTYRAATLRWLEFHAPVVTHTAQSVSIHPRAVLETSDDTHRPTAPDPLTPASIGRSRYATRVIKSATFEGVTTDALVTDKTDRLHVALGRGGVGMTTVAHLAMSPEGRTERNQIYWRPAALAELSRLTDAVHATGAKISAQIGHAGPVANARSNGLPSLAPSRRPNPLGMGFDRAATDDYIHRVTASPRHRRSCSRHEIRGRGRLRRRGGPPRAQLSDRVVSQPKINRRTDSRGESLSHRAESSRRAHSVPALPR